MLYLAWDIDGTLLLTNRAGYDALQEAICDYFFRKEPYEFKHTLAGCTDSSIIKEIVTDIKGRCTSGWAASLMLKYEMYLKRNLKAHKGYLMPNVEKTLRYLSENAPEITNLLLTGNTANGARDKVAEYGIARYFDFRHSSYGDLAEERDEVAKILYTRLLADGLVKAGERPLAPGVSSCWPAANLKRKISTTVPRGKCGTNCPTTRLILSKKSAKRNRACMLDETFPTHIIVLYYFIQQRQFPKVDCRA